MESATRKLDAEISAELVRRPTVNNQTEPTPRGRRAVPRAGAVRMPFGDDGAIRGRGMNPSNSPPFP